VYQIEMRHAEIGGLAAVLIASIDCRCADREKKPQTAKNQACFCCGMIIAESERTIGSRHLRQKLIGFAARNGYF